MIENVFIKRVAICNQPYLDAVGVVHCNQRNRRCEFARYEDKHNILKYTWFFLLIPENEFYQM